MKKRVNEDPSATVFLDNVIFYTVNELSMLISDAKFALLPCHFKSGARHDFAKGYNVF